LTNISLKKHPKIWYIRFALAGSPDASGCLSFPKKSGRVPNTRSAAAETH